MQLCHFCCVSENVRSVASQEESHVLFAVAAAQTRASLSSRNGHGSRWRVECPPALRGVPEHNLVLCFPVKTTQWFAAQNYESTCKPMLLVLGVKFVQSGDSDLVTSCVEGRPRQGPFARPATRLHHNVSIDFPLPTHLEYFGPEGETKTLVL